MTSLITKVQVQGAAPLSIVTVKIDNTIAEFWHKNVQEKIDKSKDRADRGWNWPDITKWYSKFASMLGQEPCNYSIGVVIDDDNMDSRYVPLGMMALVGKFPYLVDKSKSSTFVWWVSAMPQDLMAAYLEKLGVTGRVIGVGGTLIDIAIVHSEFTNNNGRLGLHASELGGDRLLDYYEKKLGLLRLDSAKKLPRSRGIVGNDGRYFYSDEVTANKILRNGDALR